MQNTSKVIYVWEKEWKQVGTCDTFQEGLAWLQMNQPGHFTQGTFSINIKGMAPSDFLK